MKYVDMNEAAFDPTDIVFPGLGNCHGVVYCTDQGLFAYHIYGAPADSAARAAEFARFVANHHLGRAAVGGALCGGCPSNRYAAQNNPGPEQRAELGVFASAVGFGGALWGATWNTAALGWGTTYCAFAHDAITNPPVSVRIEDFSGQPSQTALNTWPQDQKQIGIRKQNAYPGSPVVSSSIKTPTTVITGVTRKPGTPSQMIQLKPLR
jgi:hypothetical protein